MPSEMSHARSKLKPKEAALLAGEITKPSWESRNEGIHERISFEDSIWGFDLAGGSYYKTPLRVTSVKPDSRAEKAGIRPGDRLKRINDLDTSKLTIQEAHAIIIESGVHLRLAVTAPEDLEDSYHCWQDEFEDGYDSEEERRLEAEKAKKRIIHCKTNSYWSLQWPWVSKRRVIYKESNCYLVPSKYEGNHKDKFGEPATGLQTPEDIVLFNKDSGENKPAESKKVTSSTNKKIPLNENRTSDEENAMKNEVHNNRVHQNDSITNGELVNEVTEKLDGIKEELAEDSFTDNTVIDKVLQNVEDINKEEEDKITNDKPLVNENHMSDDENVIKNEVHKNRVHQNTSLTNEELVNENTGKLDGIKEELEEESFTENIVTDEILQSVEDISKEEENRITNDKPLGYEDCMSDEENVIKKEVHKNGVHQNDSLTNEELVNEVTGKLDGIKEELLGEDSFTENTVIDEVLQSVEDISKEEEDRIMEHLLEDSSMDTISTEENNR